MDIMQHDTQASCDAGTEIELTAPATGQPTGIFISIVGKDSKACQEYTREATDEALRKAHRDKSKTRASGELMTTAKMKAKAAEFLAACTTGWRVVEDGKESKTFMMGGEKMIFSEGNARKLYKALPWVAAQVDEAIGDYTLFTTA